MQVNISLSRKGVKFQNGTNSRKKNEGNWQAGKRSTTWEPGFPHSVVPDTAVSEIWTYLSSVEFTRCPQAKWRIRLAVYLISLSEMYSREIKNDNKPTVWCGCRKHWELLLSLGEALQLRIPEIVVGFAKQSDLNPHAWDECASFVCRRTGGKSSFGPSPS